MGSTPRRPDLTRAHQDLAEGRPWKAKDRLEGMLVTFPADQEVLDLLGEVNWSMGDAPEAGRAWYLTDRAGPEVDAATAAFTERYGMPGLANRLPVKAPFGAYPPGAHQRLKALQKAQRKAGQKWPKAPSARGVGQMQDSKVRGAIATIALGVILVATVGIWLVGLAVLVRWGLDTFA